MATLIVDPGTAEFHEALPHKTWSRSELKRLEATGLFNAKRYELIDGELIDKMSKSRPHVWAVKRTALALEAVFGTDLVDREAPIDVASADCERNEPEPDVVVLTRPSSAILTNPQPREVALAVEVSASTLALDLKTKNRLYARAGIAEYWVLDLDARVLHVMRDPAAGAYRSHLQFGEGSSVEPLAAPGRAIPVAGLLP